VTAGSLPRQVRPGADGRFRVEGLVSGLKYSLGVVKDGYGLEISGARTKGLTVEAGRTKDLGDIEVKPLDPP
jgi:hypothetical protein